MYYALNNEDTKWACLTCPEKFSWPELELSHANTFQKSFFFIIYHYVAVFMGH